MLKDTYDKKHILRSAVCVCPTILDSETSSGEVGSNSI